MLQTEAAECGIACLAMIASYFGHRIDLDTLRRRHPVSLKGMTLRALIETARHLELAFGFGLVTALTVAGKAIRSLTSLHLPNTLHFAMGSRLFHHLVRLPLAYFEKRHIGDILSRFISLEPIRNGVAEGLITAIID